MFSIWRATSLTENRAKEIETIYLEDIGARNWLTGLVM